MEFKLIKQENRGLRASVFIIILTALCASCRAPTDISYFQELEDLEEISTNKAVEITYKPQDIISIGVSAPDPETALPFNGSSATIDEDGSLNNGNTSGSGGSRYFIDANGMIEFPILGSLKIAGLTNIEVKEFLKEKLTAYIQNPSVSVQLQNFRVTVLGEVSTPGPLTIMNEQVTLIEAIGMAGDLGIQGKRTNITVIRKEDDKQIVHKVDLTSKDIFTSPVYYLNQNDVVYVEPNDSKAKLSRTSNWPRVLTSVTSVLGIIISVIAITR